MLICKQVYDCLLGNFFCIHVYKHCITFAHLLLYKSVQSCILDITSGHKYNFTLTATLAFPFTGPRWETAQPG